MEELIKHDDMDKRVPITFRVPVKKKHELLQCAMESGASLTDVLEVLTEDPKQKLSHDFNEVILNCQKYKARYETKIKELEQAQLTILQLEKKLESSNKEIVMGMQKSWSYRKDLLNLKQKCEILKPIPEKYKVKK